MTEKQSLNHSSWCVLAQLDAQGLDDFTELMQMIESTCEFYCKAGSHPIFLDAAARARRAIERCEKLRQLRAKEDIGWW